MPSVDLVFGPMLIGVFLNTILYGVLVVQTFIYYQTYRQDKPWIRYFVLYLFLTETANTGFNIGMMYEPLVVRYGTPRAVTRVPLMLSLDPIVTVLIAWRILIISRSKLVTAVIVFFALCAFVGGVATTVSVSIIWEYKRLQQFDGAVITWLASSAAADVMITTSLVWSLYNRKTGIKATEEVINRIIRLTVQTGMITAVSAAADVIIFLVVPKTTLNFIWDFALSKLYTNSLLSTLNARAGWSNLTGDTNQPNVLFGNDHSGSMTKVGSNRTKEDRSNRQIITTGVYELEPHTMISHDSSKDEKDADLEYGVSVTKVVERLEDPIPNAKERDLETQ